MPKTCRIFPRAYIGWEHYDGNFPLFVPDEPLSPEEMQLAIRKIMGRFYRFRHMFAVGWNVLIFPAMMLTLWNIQFGWRKWYRIWRIDLLRFGGWMIIQRWVAHFRRGPRFPAERLRHVSTGHGILDLITPSRHSIPNRARAGSRARADHLRSHPRTENE